MHWFSSSSIFQISAQFSRYPIFIAQLEIKKKKNKWNEIEKKKWKKRKCGLNHDGKPKNRIYHVKNRKFLHIHTQLLVIRILLTPPPADALTSC